MRSRWGVVALITLSLFATPSCGHADTAPGTGLSADGYGVVLGSADAPVQLETFIDPQCPHVKEFESDYGDKINHYLGTGQLALIYRPLTFLDRAKHNDISARVSNALFVAAVPATTATAYQALVQDLYRHQGGSGNGPQNSDIAAMASESGVPEQVAARIATGGTGIDIAEMDTKNTDWLKAANPENPGTPTVYDLNARNVVDLQDPGWLDKLVVPA